MIKHLIDGEAVASATVSETINPATQQVLAEVAAGGEVEVAAAVAAAKTAFPGWAATPQAQRARIMHRLGDLIAARVPEIATLVPMRYMNADKHFKVVSIAAWCMWHDLDESMRFGRAVRLAIEQRYTGKVAVFASGSLSHHFADNGRAPEFMHKVYDPFLEQVDRRVVELWQRGEWATFIDMPPMYADKCWGEGGMHDSAMLLGLLGGRDYSSPAEIITPYFGSSGAGQINAVFPVSPLLHASP